MEGKKRLAVRLCEESKEFDVENVERSPGDPKPRLSSQSSPSPSPKWSRRSVDKRVVSFPISRATGAASETTPPADSWAWRKYGQKPIKGSPYPRGYYRCSSSKGCPARKQVERSRVDPTKLVVTYSGDHVHSSKTNAAAATYAATANYSKEPDPNPIHGSPQHEFSDLIADEPDLMTMPDEDFLVSGVGSTISSSWAELAPDDCAKTGAVGEEDDELFDGLGELPEYSVVFRRSYLERQMAAG